MTSYDATIVYRFADRMEAQAQSAIWGGLVGGGLLGLICGFLLSSHSMYGPIVIIAGGVIGALIGWSIGSERAFKIRVALHTMLCQVQIEENTRPARSAAPSGGSPLAHYQSY
jgi:hypothetical protein